MNRRTFIEKSGVAAGAAALGSVMPINADASTTVKSNNKKPSNIKQGLYSISYGGIWYEGPALSFEEMCKKAKEYGFEGVELDNKRPMGCPLDLNQKKRDEMKNTLAKYGLEIPAVAANNDFSSPIPEHRECQLLMVRETARLAKDLGAKYVRLFAAWTGIPIHDGIGTYDLVQAHEGYYSFQRQFPYTTHLERYNYVKQCLAEAAKWGEEFGVIMTLQNHGPMIRHWKDTYDLVKEVNSPFLKICLDLSIFENFDKNYIANAVHTIGELQVHSHYGGEFFRDSTGKVVQRGLDYRFGEPIPDFEHYIGLMKEIGYNGYFCYELCHPCLHADHTRAGLDFVNEQVQLGQKYLKAIINK
jgi:sugar phosphate isomerase/epimerase